MFATITTYTCNGCMKTATEDKANNWMHLNNSPDNGKCNMDFCPDCTVSIQSVLLNTVTKPTEPTESAEPTEPTEPVVDSVDTVYEDTIDSEAAVNTEDTDVSNIIDSKLAEFYKRLYTRVLFDIAWDNKITKAVKYLPYIPGRLAVDKRSTLADTHVMLLINSRRVRIEKDSAHATATTITIYNGASVAVTRKISTFEGVRSLIQDLSSTDVALLPTSESYYTIKYLKSTLTNLNKVTDTEVPTQEIKNWIVFSAELNSIDLT